MAFFCCFDQLHRWNAALCPLLGLIANIGLVWLILNKTPKEMRVHSRILLQTCICDILLLALIAVGQPVMSIQPDGAVVVLFQGIFPPLPNNPHFLAIFFAAWFALHNFQVNGLSVQFLYRFFVLNCRAKISPFRYVLMLSVPFLSLVGLAIYWHLMISPSLGLHQIDTHYLANFMESESALQLTSLTYSFDPNGVLFKIWNYLYEAIQIVTYALALFCAIKMVRFVNAYSGFNSKLKELNRQLSRTLILLASFPLFLLSFNLFLQFYGPHFLARADANAINTMALAQMCYGLSTHWLPVLNPLATIVTIKPYRNALLRGIRIVPTSQGGGGQTPASAVVVLPNNNHQHH